MAVDKNKVTAEATKLVQKGSFDKAIKAYEKILAEDPKDVRVLLKVGELHQKKFDSAAAAAVYGRAAEAYSEQGFFLKAVAVYKQMMKLSPDDVGVNERLAGLYQQLGILSDSMAQLQLVAQGAEKAGDGAKLLDVLRRMVDLDPDNAASSVKLGELYAKTSQPKLALEQFRRAAEGLKRNNRADEYVKVAERIALIDGQDVGLLRELAHAYLAKGDAKRALAKLQLCFKLDPKDVETLTLLAQAFNDLGQTSKTVSVCKELAHLHAEHGRAEQARAAWRRVAELVPDDADAVHALGSARASPPRAPVAARAPVPPSPPPPVSAKPQPPPVQPAPRPAVGPAAAPPPRAVGSEAIPKLLTETDVYVKYGLHEKALEHLARIFAIDPDHLDAREKARDVRAARHDAAGAAEEAVRAVRIALASGLSERANAAAARLREIAPEHPELAVLAGGDAPALVVPEDAAELIDVDGEELVLEIVPAAGDGGDDLALEAARAPVDEVVEEETSAAPTATAAPPALARPPAISPPPAIAPPPAPVPPPAFAPAPVPPPALALPPVARSPVVAPPIPSSSPASPRSAPARVVAPPPPEPVLAPPPPPAQARPSAEDDEEDDLTDELQEASFLVEQGLVDEAREALSVLLSFHPGHSKLVARLAELERAPVPAAPEDLAPPAEEGFDLARELAAELDAAAPAAANDDVQFSVADVFSQFKRGVEETVKPEDADTHYDLGIAYKEMGLLDDAVHEFEVALSGQGRKKEVDCLTMIGLCHMERGDAVSAVEAFRRTLRSDLLTPEAARAVHYELGAAYASIGDKESALYYLHKVVKVDPRFRDSKALVERLGGGPGRPPPGDEPAGSRPADRGPKKNIGYV